MEISGVGVSVRSHHHSHTGAKTGPLALQSMWNVIFSDCCGNFDMVHHLYQSVDLSSSNQLIDKEKLVGIILHYYDQVFFVT